MHAPRFSHYDFIDVSAGLCKKAKDLLRAQAERMSFRVLDIKTDVIEQGFEAKTYDLIVVSNIFHATNILDITLVNIRKLLRRGARCILFEMRIFLRHPNWVHIRSLANLVAG